MLRIALLVVPAALLLTAPALAQSRAQPPSPAPAEKVAPDPIQPDAAAPAARDEIGVPAHVWAVRIAGGWEADGGKGFSRVIGVFEGDRQKLVVQWLAEPDGRIVAAKVLDDEDAAKLTFGDMRAEPADQGGVTVFIDTVPDADDIRDTWVLVIGAPGDARFGPATN